MGTPTQGVIEFRRRSLPPPQKRVLCVDDDPAIGRLLARWLEREGYDAVATSHPRDALALLYMPRPFNVMITDQNMPDIKGTELSRLALSARPELVVALMTAEDDRLLPDDLLASGVSFLVAKPFALRTISDCLTEALGQRARTSVAVRG